MPDDADDNTGQGLYEVKQPEQARGPATFGERIDRAIYAAFPLWGAKRMARRRMWEVAQKRARRLESRFDESSSGASYDTDTIRGKSWLASRLSPQSQVERDLESARDKSDELCREDVYAAQIVRGFTKYRIGTGLTPQPAIRPSAAISEPQADLWNEQLLNLFRRFQSHSSPDGRQSFFEQCRVASKHWDRHGDAFIVVTARRHTKHMIPLALDVIHPARVETPPGKFSDPQCRLGIQYDENGGVLGYWIRKNHPRDTLLTDQNYRFWAADEVAHIFDPDQAKQGRGVPRMRPAISDLKDIKDHREATIVKEQIEASFAAFIKPGGDAHGVMAADAPDTDSKQKRLKDIYAGMISYLNPGEEIEFANPNRVGGQFGQFVSSVLRGVAAGVDYCYSLLTKDFSGANYTRGKLELNDFQRTIQCEQAIFKSRFLRWFWSLFVRECVATVPFDLLAIRPSEYADDPYLFEMHTWTPPGVPFVDPPKEIPAKLKAIDGLLTTLTEELAAQGKNFDEVLDRRAAELRKVKAKLGAMVPTAGGDEQPPDGEAEQDDETNEAEEDAFALAEAR